MGQEVDNPETGQGIQDGQGDVEWVFFLNFSSIIDHPVFLFVHDRETMLHNADDMNRQLVYHKKTHAVARGKPPCGFNIGSETVLYTVEDHYPSLATMKH